ncbi:MAG: DUF1501 domain-containing protein [Bacteroidota bacterium]
MKRRNFIKLTSAAAAAPIVLNGLPLKAFATPDMLRAMNCSEVKERILVLIQLRGGNDGLNTLIPINQYTDYRTARPNIFIPDAGANSYITLDTSLPANQQIGLHPAMTEIKSLYDQGKVSIIQGVAYNDQNRSHFKSTDLWLSAGDGTPANFNKTSGWMGRYLNFTYPGLAGNPQPFMPDPLGIQLGDPKPSLGFHTEQEHSSGINLSGQDPSGFYSLISEIGGPGLKNIPDSEYGDEIQFIMDMEASTSKYAQRISDVFNQGINMGNYPNHDLADQLKTVARLINGGCQSKVYLVQLNGFDTHVNQVEAGASTTGDHAELLLELSESVKAFLDDLELMSLDNKVIAATFSEFGRKPGENGSFGTDHGDLAPMFIFGKAVNPGIIGENPDFSTVQNNLFVGYQHDYRQVFTTLVQDWLGASNDALMATEMDAYLPNKLAIVDKDHYVDPACYFSQITDTTDIEQEIEVAYTFFPNPVQEEVHISFSSTLSHLATVFLRDIHGRLILQEKHQILAGPNMIDVEFPDLPNGPYILQLVSDQGANMASEKVMLRR